VGNLILCRLRDLFGINLMQPDPYPFAIDEAFDVYRLLVDSGGTSIGMSGRKLNVILTGDSA